MFDAITIRRRSSCFFEADFDVGFLAEALIFYSDTRLIANRAVLTTLFQHCSPEVILELIESGFLRLTYQPDDVAIMTTETGMPNERHQPVCWTMPHLEIRELLPELLEKTVGRPRKARRLANRLIQGIEIVRHDANIANQARQDLLNPVYVSASIRALLKQYVPAYNVDDVRFTVVAREDKVGVDTNINFNTVNAEYHKRVSPLHSTVTPAYLLAQLISVRADLEFAARYKSEIAVDDINAMIIREHFAHLLLKQQRSTSQIAQFQEFLFNDARAIGEAIRSGERTLSDIVSVLQRAAKFKKWLRQQSIDTELVKEYFREVTSETWINKLPAKGLRWFLFTGAGMAFDVAGGGGLGTAAGVGLSAIDAFFLDRLLAGWKPNQFVARHIEPLLKK
jgi:hypothetical protein